MAAPSHREELISQIPANQLPKSKLRIATRPAHRWISPGLGALKLCRIGGGMKEWGTCHREQGEARRLS